MLVITPRAKKGAPRCEHELRLLPCVAPATFPLARLGPARNNMRAAVAAGAGADAATELLATPHYNAAILRVWPRRGALAERCCAAQRELRLQLMHFHPTQAVHSRRAAQAAEMRPPF